MMKQSPFGFSVRATWRIVFQKNSVCSKVWPATIISALSGSHRCGINRARLVLFRNLLSLSRHWRREIQFSGNLAPLISVFDRMQPPSFPRPRVRDRVCPNVNRGVMCAHLSRTRFKLVVAAMSLWMVGNVLDGQVPAFPSANSQLLNISTRLRVRPGDDAMIGGFIIAGTQPKTVLVRGIGPSLPLSGALADPIIEVHSSAGELLATNDNWNDAATRQEIIDSGIAPANALESALWGIINPGAYTVVVRGKNGSSGIGLFEVYDLNRTVDSQLANVSTRGFVETGDNVMIGGIIVGPVGAPESNVLIRAVGPSLIDFGIQNPVLDPVLELHDGNGALIGSNDNWKDAHPTEIQATGLAPQNDAESAILTSLTPGAYTAILAGKSGGTGVAVVEVFGLAPANTATLTVRTFLPSDLVGNGLGLAGPAGTTVSINGSEMGTTQADGTVTLKVPAGALQVSAEIRPSNSGQASVTVVPGETKQVDIVLADGKELSENSLLKIDQLVNSVLDRNFSGLTVRFTKPDGSTVALKSFDIATLEDAQGDNHSVVTDFFTLQSNGTLLLNNPNSFRDLLLKRSGKILLSVHGDDSNGGVNDGTVEFFVSAYKISGNLAAPPSNSALNKAGISVTGRILNTDLLFNVISDQNGNFQFPLLPAGNFEFTSQTQQNGRFYYGQGTLVLDGNKILHINMLATEDLVSGVAPFTVENASGASLPVVATALGPTAERQNMASMKIFPAALLPSGTQVSDSSASVSVAVTAAQQNTPIAQQATLNIPQGTKTVDLTYTVQTDEYPYYVLHQSIYNDTWSLTVRGGASGQQIFSDGKQINSQLKAPPVWQSDGTTGTIKKTINVENLAAGGATNLVLVATAMNVGDSILPTRVSATLGPDPGVKINDIVPDTTVPNYKGQPKAVLNFYSIPRPGNTNVFDRFFTLGISKPDQATVKKVTVTLLGPGPLMTVVDEAPGSGSIEKIDEKTLRVRVSVKPKPSTVASQPPAPHQIKYRFKLVALVNGAEVSDEKDSGECLGLWRMPDGFARYSIREAGGDDWCSRGTYNWLAANSSLITKINDISGEHGRNIGHTTHRYGTDIDMFHFYTFPGADSGGKNYQKLVDDVKAAMNAGSAAEAAKQRVKNWVTATRVGLDALAAKPEVIELRYALGWGFSLVHPNEAGLSSGWAKELLTTGKTTVGGTSLIVDTASWTNTNKRYVAVNDHNDHVHITLSRPVLKE
ncbi:MAG TPA: hypothetical protein VE031_00185 [Chthoniobacterales bacterium]|nr:hypothetical protein [Chthoniobacterales bacterium]